MLKLRYRDANEREALVQRIASNMDGPMTALGFIFLLLVLAETLVRPVGAVGQVFGVVSWALWFAFVLEFVIRATVAPSTGAFLKRNWWQLIFLLLPFLRFARALSRLRIGRLGRVISSGVRSGRGAKANLSSRLGWLAALTLIVILAVSQLVFELGDSSDYGTALYDVAIATITGNPIEARSPAVRLVNVGLALYSVIVFAALAATLGAFFVEGSAERKQAAADDLGSTNESVN
jgi:voltage-gated potassium channel